METSTIYAVIETHYQPWHDDSPEDYFEPRFETHVYEDMTQEQFNEQCELMSLYDDGADHRMYQVCKAVYDKLNS